MARGDIERSIGSRMLVLATRNRHKIVLYSEAFRFYGWETVGIEQLGLDGHVEENAQTAEANALAKARAAWSEGLAVFGTDVGLEIDALNGEPGLQTRRWNGKFTEDVSDGEWLGYLLDRMDGVPLPRRTARFVTGWAIVKADGTAYVTRVVTPFLIAEQPLFPLVEGWPLSSVLIRQPEAEQDDAQLIRRELGKWLSYLDMNR